MRRKFLTLFLTILLTLTMSAIASANAEPDVNYENGSQSLNMIETSKGHLLISQAEFDFDAWVDNYTILRYSSDGTELGKLSLGLGFQHFGQYNGKAYVVFIEYGSSILSVYDENLQLVKEQSFAHLEGSDIEFYGVEDELVYLFNFTNTDIYTFSLATLEIIPTTHTIQGASVEALENYNALITYDQFHDSLGEFPLTGTPLEGADYSGEVFLNNTLYVARANDKVIEVAKINLNGQIEATTNVELPIKTLGHSISLNAVKMDDKILFYNDTYEAEQDVYVFIYNTATEQIEYKAVKNGMPTYEYYANGMIREFTYDSNGATTFYNTNFEKLYTLDIKEGASLLYPGGDYLIVNDKTTKAYHSVLYDITTGKAIRTLYTSDNLYNEIGVAEAILFDESSTIYYVVQAPSYDMVANDAKGYFTQVASKGSANEINPTTRIVTPTKIWTATLSQEVDPTSVTNQTVIVKNENGEQLDVSVKAEGKQIFITPPASHYEVGNYSLTLKDLKSASGKTLKKATTINFTVQ